MQYCKNTSLSICGIVRTHYFQLGLCNTTPVGCITVTIVTVEQHIINSTCVYSICTMCFEKNSHVVLKYMCVCTVIFTMEEVAITIDDKRVDTVDPDFIF